MPAGRYFQGLTTFDLLGNLIPGTVVTTAIIALLPSVHAPGSIPEYFLAGIAAFSFGHFIQKHASSASGDRQTFEQTMDAVRGGRLEDEKESSETGDSDEVETDGGKRSEREEKEDGKKSVISRAVNLTNNVVSHIFYAATMPVFWWYLSSRGQALDDVILPNRVWKDLLETYDIDRGTDNYSVLFHMISSEVDDVGSPSRAVRFQAIRNFHRGMWIAMWYILCYCVLFFLVDAVFTIFGMTAILGVQIKEPYLFRVIDPNWQIIVVLSLLLVGFWYLADNFEEEFIEYLFTDYVVARKNEQNTIEVIGLRDED